MIEWLYRDYIPLFPIRNWEVGGRVGGAVMSASYYRPLYAYIVELYVDMYVLGFRPGELRVHGVWLCFYP